MGEKKMSDKDSSLKDLDGYVKEVSVKNDEMGKELRHKTDTISIMNDENVGLNKEMEGLKKNLKVLQINTDTLVYEDETRSKELEVLMTKCNELETKYWELAKKEKRQQNELNRNNVTIEAHEKAEEQYEERINGLQENLDKTKEAIRDLQIISEQRADRGSKIQDDDSRELTLAQSAAKDLQVENEVIIQERSEMYRELLAAQKHIFFIEEEIKVRDKGIEIMNEKYERLHTNLLEVEEDKQTMQETIMDLRKNGNHG